MPPGGVPASGLFKEEIKEKKTVNGPIMVRLGLAVRSCDSAEFAERPFRSVVRICSRDPPSPYLQRVFPYLLGPLH